MLCCKAVYRILKKLIQNTHNGEFESTVLTFFPHPRMVLQGKTDLKLLNTIDEKIRLFEKILKMKSIKLKKVIVFS